MYFDADDDDGDGDGDDDGAGDGDGDGDDDGAGDDDGVGDDGGGDGDFDGVDAGAGPGDGGGDGGLFPSNMQWKKILTEAACVEARSRSSTHSTRHGEFRYRERSKIMPSSGFAGQPPTERCEPIPFCPRLRKLWTLHWLLKL